jgi:tetratricopeptide (TPR) repeat protein
MNIADNISDRPVTDGTIALRNLQAQIGGMEPDVRLGRAAAAGQADFIELITLRGLILGHIADYERAAQLAEGLVSDAATDATAFLARSRTRGVFHRFAAALEDLDHAERLSLDTRMIHRERVAIFQAVGRYDEALVLREEAARLRRNFENVAALVSLHAERGEFDAAQHLYTESRGLYRGVSPFPLALLDFQLGLMWMGDDQLENARTSFEAALRLVPAYAAAQGHLAEVEAELGEIESAIDRLNYLAVSSDDPDYAGQLARILGDAGRAHESCHWRALAAQRFDELIARHPEAFADHAAEFWLGAGADPDKALRLAKINVGVRNTPRARRLLADAIAAISTTANHVKVDPQH